MTELERKIRKAIDDFCSDMCAQQAEKAIVAVLQLHNSDGHMCIGHLARVWTGPGENCPTVVAIAQGLGLLDSEDGSDA